MKEFKNEIYALVDEEYISKFSMLHISFMKKQYYNYYCDVCSAIKRKPLKKKEFFTNMRRRRFQIYQLCCPYCGSVHMVMHDKKEFGKAGFNYCFHCGKGSALENIKTQIYRFMRIRNINSIGLSVLKERYPETEEWLLGFDCYQMELIELASIIEVIFRGYFEALLFINNLGIKSEYITSIINKHTGNNFMNIEKANTDYKKAFDLDLKKVVEKDVWNDLIDIVNLRNMMIHNNGMADERLKKTATYKRLNDKFSGKLFKLDSADINKYLKSVTYAVTVISNLYLEQYYTKRNTVIANYYFNIDKTKNKISDEFKK